MALSSSRAGTHSPGDASTKYGPKPASVQKFCTSDDAQPLLAHHFLQARTAVYDSATGLKAVHHAVAASAVKRQPESRGASAPGSATDFTRVTFPSDHAIFFSSRLMIQS
jgi:hypothetical protein